MSSETQETIRRNILRLIHEHNLTQRDFAEKIGVQESTVGKWLNGKAGPRMGMIETIARVFNISKLDILSDSAPQGNALDPTGKYLMDEYKKASADKKELMKRLWETIKDDEQKHR